MVFLVTDVTDRLDITISEAKFSATFRRLDLPPSSGGKGRVVTHSGEPNRNCSL
jgi:hypothetical protein